MRVNKGWLIALLVLGLGTAGVVRTIVAKRQSQAALAQTDAASTRPLALADADLWRVREQVMVRSVAVSGTARAVQSAVVKARAAGEVTQVLVREGMAVKAGQLLVQLDTREAQTRLEQARQQADAAKAQLAIAQRTLENQQALVGQGFISRTALDTAQFNAQAAQATWQAAQANARLADKALADTRVLAPLSGTVSKQHVQAGEHVNPDARLIEVVDLSRMEMEVSLQPADVAPLQTGTPGQVTVDGVPEPLAVQVARINPSAAPGTRALTVYLSVAAHPALRQGLFARGQLTLGRETGLLVPRTVVRSGPRGPFVQVLRQGRVAHQAVALGTEGLLLDAAEQPETRVVRVTRGLQPGDEVLRDNLGLVREGTAVQRSPSDARATKG
jgi:RND family efflux transporter MFP subunit